MDERQGCGVGLEAQVEAKAYLFGGWGLGRSMCQHLTAGVEGERALVYARAGSPPAPRRFVEGPVACTGSRWPTGLKPEVKPQIPNPYQAARLGCEVVVAAEEVGQPAQKIPRYCSWPNLNPNAGNTRLLEAAVSLPRGYVHIQYTYTYKYIYMNKYIEYVQIFILCV